MNFCCKPLNKFLLKLFGFTMDYTVPEEAKKCVLVFAPHTSMWDFVVGKMVLDVMGLNVKFMIRKESFRFPMNIILNLLGGIPVDRQHVRMLPVHIGNMIKKEDNIAVLIAPEGTRKRVEVWKKGFYFIAQYAEVPMCLCYIDWGKKIGGIGPVIKVTGDYDADLKAIQDFYRGMKGRHPENFNL